MSSDDAYASWLGRFYAFYIEHPPLARFVGKVTWGSSFSALYSSLERLRELPTTATVLDACCGAGLALHWLDPSISRYIGIDNSPSMLARARRLAEQRGYANAELLLADAESIPLPDASVDVALLYNALHAVTHPAGTLTEVGRCLKPAGQLVGTMVVRGRGRRADRFIEREAAKQHSLIGPGGSESDLASWLNEAGFHPADYTSDGTLIAFRASRA